MTVLKILTIDQLRHLANLAAAARAGRAYEANAVLGLAEAAAGYDAAPIPSESRGVDRALRAEVGSLGAAARTELIALAQIGHRDLSASDLGPWRAKAAAMNDEEVEAILARPSLADDLEAGAERVGLSVR